MAIEIVIGYDKESKMYKAYEPTTDTLLITTSLGETFLKLSEFLQQQGMIAGDILSAQNISYHIDSPSFIAMVESNANLLKRLRTGPSQFQMSQSRFGQSQNQLAITSDRAKQRKTENNWKESKTKWKKAYNNNNSTFSRSAFKGSSKKFGG